MKSPAIKSHFAAQPFRVEVPESELEDLRLRLQRTRWPIEPRDARWRYGTPLGYMREVVEYWRTGYDWRHWEARLNAVPGYRAMLGGKRLHFLLERGSGPDPLPLVLTHGWPGSIVEFLDVIEPLAHPERFGGDESDAFTVIVPSLPGYGFSDAPDAPISHRQIGALWHELIVDVLGCTRYVAQGGDVGAMVSSWLALERPQGMRALHLNRVAFEAEIAEGVKPLDASEKEWFKASKRRREGEMGYQQIQSTKPQTLAYGLTDSPAGLAAWILEKFHGWTIRGSDSPPPFELGHLLTNVMLHWLGGPNAPTWTYPFSTLAETRRPPLGRRVEVPTGMLLFPNDTALPPPDRWIRRSYNLVHRRDGTSGGHFAALENGALFVEDLRTFCRPYRW